MRNHVLSLQRQSERKYYREQLEINKHAIGESWKIIKHIIGNEEPSIVHVIAQLNNSAAGHDYQVL